MKNPGYFWTEQIYHCAEHFYWEPQHLNTQRSSRQAGNMAQFYDSIEKIRNQEVPLNLLFNILLRLLPRRINSGILGCFVSPAEVDFGHELRYITIYDEIGGTDFVQPDAVLESETAHVCLELKIDARLSASQLYKYIFLLALWQSRTETRKLPCLFFLTKKDLAK